MLAGDLGQGGPVRGLAEQVNTDNRSRFQAAGGAGGYDALGEVVRVDLESARVHVNEDGSCAENKGDLGGGGVGEGGKEDSIARTNVLGHQGNLQCVGAGADADAMLRAAERGEGGFKLLNLGAKDELAMR